MTEPTREVVNITVELWRLESDRADVPLGVFAQDFLRAIQCEMAGRQTTFRAEARAGRLRTEVQEENIP